MKRTNDEQMNDQKVSGKRREGGGRKGASRSEGKVRVCVREQLLATTPAFHCRIRESHRVV